MGVLPILVDQIILVMLVFLWCVVAKNPLYTTTTGFCWRLLFGVPVGSLRSKPQAMRNTENRCITEQFWIY